jgi:hypothetical protein
VVRCALVEEAKRETKMESVTHNLVKVDILINGEKPRKCEEYYCEEAYERLGNIYRRIIGQLGDNAYLQKEMIYIIFLRKNNL